MEHNNADGNAAANPGRSGGEGKWSGPTWQQAAEEKQLWAGGDPSADPQTAQFASPQGNFGASGYAGRSGQTGYGEPGVGPSGFGPNGPGAPLGGQPAPMPGLVGQPKQHSSTSKGLAALGLVAAMLLAGGIGGVVGVNLAGGGHTSVLGAGDANPVPDSAPTDGTVESVADKVVPSVVSITSAGRRQGGGGSGVIISADGMIITNAHVVMAGGRNSKLQVSFSDGRIAEAKLVGEDATSDIAVIKVDENDLPAVTFGTAKNLKVGQDVVAIGSPLGLSGTVTTGIVSALDRPVMAGGSQSDQSTVLDAVQTDAAINPGNSGGALVDMGGNLIGINSAIASLGQEGEAGSIGLGFAIPVDQAKRIADQLINQGYATRAVLGASVVSDPAIVGAQLDGVEKGGPAEQAGIPEDAVVTKMGDRVIDSGDELVAAVRSQTPGDTVQITYREGDTEKTAEVTLGEAKS